MSDQASHLSEGRIMDAAMGSWPMRPRVSTWQIVLSARNDCEFGRTTKRRLPSIGRLKDRWAEPDNTEDPCPSLIEIANYVAGNIPQDEALIHHLHQCDRCATVIRAAVESGLSTPAEEPALALTSPTPALRSSTKDWQRQIARQFTAAKPEQVLIKSGPVQPLVNCIFFTPRPPLLPCWP